MLACSLLPARTRRKQREPSEAWTGAIPFRAWADGRHRSNQRFPQVTSGPARPALACGSCQDPNLWSIAVDLPVQPDNRLDHQLSAADQRFRPSQRSESPAGGTRRSASKNHALTSANADLRERESVSLTPALSRSLSLSAHHLRYTRHTSDTLTCGRHAAAQGCGYAQAEELHRVVEDPRRSGQRHW